MLEEAEQIVAVGIHDKLRHPARSMKVSIRIELFFVKRLDAPQCAYTPMLQLPAFESDRNCWPPKAPGSTRPNFAELAR
jgi:hypothetical protein